MEIIKTPIIPVKPTYVGCEDDLDYKAICFFAATNFFLADDTYYKNSKCLQPGKEYRIEDNKIVSDVSWFKWHYSPKDISFEQSVNDFELLFDRITKEQVENKRVILPLSGGLDSRTQAAALTQNDRVWSYSYEYENGIKEAKIAQKIAKEGGFGFSKYHIPNGYLWDKIEGVAKLIDYGGDITSPRQASIMENLNGKGDVLYLGHWGDVLFDNMNINENVSFDELVKILEKKIVKKGGREIGKALWQAWGLNGDFDVELRDRLSLMLGEINISNNNARVRAFKSTYWAPRWTSIYLQVFADKHKVALPYYDDRMNEFICSIPEDYLAGRKIQMEYIKRKSKKMASISWQPYRPYNLYNYNRYNSLPNFFRRGVKKVLRYANPSPFIQRNWEIQFLGEKNETHLKKWLFENEKFNTFVPSGIVEDFYSKFKSDDSVYYFHPITTLLTLSVFAKHKL